MKEALKLCIAELSEARGEVDEVMHNCAAALAGTEKGAGRVAEYRRQLARIDAAVAAAEAAMAQPDPEPVARRHGGAVLFRLRGFTVPLYAGSALAQSAHPLELPTPEMLRAAQLQSAIGAEICANWAGAYDALTELWQAMEAAAPTQSTELAAVAAERDQLRVEVDRLNSTPPDQREDLHCVVSAVTAERDRLRARVAELEAAAQPPAAARAPLNREQVNQIMRDAGYSPAPAQARADFINGLRWGERAHGIKAHPTP